MEVIKAYKMSILIKMEVIKAYKTSLLNKG